MFNPDPSQPSNQGSISWRVTSKKVTDSRQSQYSAKYVTKKKLRYIIRYQLKAFIVLHQLIFIIGVLENKAGYTAIQSRTVGQEQ